MCGPNEEARKKSTGFLHVGSLEKRDIDILNPHDCSREVPCSCASRHARWVFMSLQKCGVGWDLGRSHSQAAALMPRPSLTCVCLRSYWKPLLKGLANFILFIKCLATFALRKFCPGSKRTTSAAKGGNFFSPRDAELFSALSLATLSALGGD